jgi:hypothetical protein
VYENLKNLGCCCCCGCCCDLYVGGAGVGGTGVGGTGVGGTGVGGNGVGGAVYIVNNNTFLSQHLRQSALTT